MTAERRDERSIGELVGDLTRQIGLLVRQEMDLARAEVTASARTVARDAALIGLGGALLYAAFLGAMAAVVLGLIDAGVSPWLAAIVVAILVAIAGGAMVARGRSGLATADLTPRRTVETLKEDAELAKEQLS
ncbi:MAG: phage holin family protein [Chloroflexota bacterium]